MARRKVRTVGAVIVNPRRRRKRSTAKRRKRSTAKRRTVSRRRKANPKRKRKTVARRRRANPKRRRRTVAKRRRTTRRRRTNPYVLRSNPRRKRRKAPRVRRRKVRRVRKNPGLVAGLQATMKKIPFIGAPLAIAAGVVPYAAVGAPLGVELPMQAAKYMAMWEGKPSWLSFSEPMTFALYGLGAAVLTHYAAKMLGMTPATCEKAAIAVGSAAMGAGYYTMRYGQQVGATPSEVATGENSTEGLGALMAGPYVLGQSSGMGAVAIGGYGMGPAYTAGPQGYGAVLVGA